MSGWTFELIRRRLRVQIQYIVYPNIIFTFSGHLETLVVWRTWMISFLSSWVTTGDTGKHRQLHAWLLEMSRVGPWTKHMWSVVQFIVALCLSSRPNTSENMKDPSNHSIEVQPLFGWSDGQALAAVLHEMCIAELNFSRKYGGDAVMDVTTVQAWCCKSLTVLALRSAAQCRSWPKLWRETTTWPTWIWKVARLKSKASRWGAWCGIRFQV